MSDETKNTKATEVADEHPTELKGKELDDVQGGHHLRKAYDLNPNDLSVKVALEGSEGDGSRTAGGDGNDFVQVNGAN